MKSLIIIALSIIVLFACEIKKNNERKVGGDNPFAEGFDLAGSDDRAIEIADKVMLAMGGRKNWDNERYFKWNFFGSRTLWWDKLTGDVRIQMHNSDSTIILINIFDKTGRVFSNGLEMLQTDSVSKYLNRGMGIWINDSYWLFMPFKLKDSGVTLTYVGEDTTQNGKASDVLQLTFKNVGNTPQNKYHIWIDQSDNLIKQWAFFSENVMEEPNFITPWEDYKLYNSIYLAGNRGQREITNIEVHEEMEEALFREF